MKITFDLTPHLVQSVIDAHFILQPGSIAGIETRCRMTEMIEKEVAEIVCGIIIKQYIQQKRLPYNKK